MDIEVMREDVARAIWNIRREEEDRYDMELEDIDSDHSVWDEADAAIEAIHGRSDYKRICKQCRGEGRVGGMDPALGGKNCSACDGTGMDQGRQ